MTNQGQKWEGNLDQPGSWVGPWAGIAPTNAEVMTLDITLLTAGGRGNADSHDVPLP